jgi:hypothetical protein
LSIKVFIFAFFGIFGLIILIGGIGSGKKQSRIDAYSREVPGEIYYDQSFTSYGNSDYSGSNDGIYEDPFDPNQDWDGDTDAPDIPFDPAAAATLQAIYRQAQNYVGSNYGTVTVPLDVVYPGDYWYEWLYDWAWCVSTPSGIHCKGDKLSASSPTYVHNLFVHELIHRLQGGCSLYMSEWGADYLSNNAGGYVFDTAGGCIRATELPTNSCSSQDKIDAALCKNTGSACFQEISRKISGFCTR